ncbi:DUF2231 domain-containing protein [Actinophytocola sp. KF-1]
MPTFLAGLPLHALVVHAVVVLVPLAVLAAVAVAVWPAARRRFDWLAVAVATVATAAIPVATSTGEALRDRLAPDPAITTHAELGDQLLVLVAPMTIALIGFVLLTRHMRRTDGPGAKVADKPRWARPGTLVLAVAVVALAAASVVQVVRIGDSGARAVWHNTHYVTPTHSTSPSNTGQNRSWNSPLHDGQGS